jgi:LacI family transcriptional regulator
VISQRKIARMLKLSPATVSRALRNLPGTDSRTQAAVLDAAARMGYRMSSLCDASASEQVDALLGLLICGEASASSGIFSQFLHGASEAARQMEVSLHVDYVGHDRAQSIGTPVNQSRALRQRQVGGLILVGPFPPDTVSELAGQFPCVRLNIRDVGVPLDCIAQDDQQAANELVDHLARHGHRRIGFLCANQAARFTYGRARFAGYIEALTLQGLPIDPELWVGVQAPLLDEPAALHRARMLTARGVTAWVCVHDALGYNLLHDFAEHGLSVPHDASIVGFDALAAPSGLPKMTSIKWPFEDMGATAVRRLMLRMRNPLLAVGHSVYSGTLVPGQTTGDAQQR